MRKPAYLGAVYALFLALLPSVGKAGEDKSVNIAFYNLYQFFDANHDEGKDDWTFLPKGYPGKLEYCNSLEEGIYREECLKSDYTEAHVDLKISQMEKAVRGIHPTLPDLLGLCEVENNAVVQRFADKLGFSHVFVTNSPDKRGIDVALLFNLKSGLTFIRSEEHVMAVIEGQRPTRNVLEAEFDFHGQRLIVFVNHWPSQAQTAPVRINVAKQVQQIVDARLEKNPDIHILLMGDFNTQDGDYPHPFKSVITADTARNPLLDAYDLYKANRDIPPETRNQMPLGSFFFASKMAWDRLDRFFVNKKLADGSGFELDSKTYGIKSPPFLTATTVYEDPRYPTHGSQVTNTPGHPDFFTLDPEKAGYSDHFPIYVQLRLN